MNALPQQIEASRKSIKTDHYSMSIGEIANLYKDKDLKLDPAFQRLFRWKDEQKTKFIESILLGIPIPEIFVAQDNDGKWTVIDGVQRISTILQLLGELPNYDPLKMIGGAKYLPALTDMTWKDMPEEAQRIFKRAKLGINIVLTDHGIDAQYELFQRLNTGGVHLEDQEIRNCLIIMLSPSFYEKINELKNHPSFIGCINLTEKKYSEEYHMELILRYFIAVSNFVDYTKYSLSNIHVGEFFDKETAALIQNSNFDLEKQIAHFKAVFDWIHDALGNLAFKQYDASKDKFDGGFSNASFEAITAGVATHFDKIKAMDKPSFLALIKKMYGEDEFKASSRHGTRAPLRFQKLTEFSKKYFDV